MRVCPICYNLFGSDTTTCPQDGTPTENHVQVMLGKSLGPYRVRSVLGEGGMGVVYAGEHPGIGRRVALKVLRPELSLRDDLVDRFIQEARAVNTIGHRNIVNIYDFGKTPFGSFYIVMEFLDGKNLRAYLDQEKIQPLDRVRLVVRGVGAALAAAHAKSFIHRDVKPENIMLGLRVEREWVKLLDFGIVKLTGRSEFETQGTALMGTPRYMSPEQLEQSNVDHRADIFGLAAVVYEMLTGQVPYPGRNVAEIRELQLTRTPSPPSVCNERQHLSRKIDAAVLWGLNLSPENRCNNVVDFITAFEDGYHDDPGPRTRWSGKRARLSLPRLVLWLSVVAVVMGLAVGLGLRKGDPTAREGAAGGKPPPPVTRAGANATRPGVDDAGSAENLQGRARAAVQAALTSRRATERAAVLEMMGELGSKGMVLEVIAALEDADPNVRRTAARTLGKIKDPRAIPQLRKALASSLEFLTVDIAQSLALLGDRSAVIRLKRELKRAKNPITRKYVLHALGSLGEPAALAWREFTQQKQLALSPGMFRALGYLAQLGEADARAELEQSMKSGSWPLRVLAARAYLPLDQEAAAEVLRSAVSLAPGVERTEAAISLAQIGDDSSLNVLIESSKSAETILRWRSILALARLPRPQARQRLRDALGAQDREVALAAAVALLD